MEPYLSTLPPHDSFWLGQQDLFVEYYPGSRQTPLLMVHGAYTGSWMWCKYLPALVEAGYPCYVMNLRGHYLSRAVDMTRVTFADYVADVAEVAALCKTPLVLVGFSMGGIIGQVAAQTLSLRGLALAESSVCRQVYQQVPYPHREVCTLGNVVPAPARTLQSADETEEDILFQQRYLAEESALAFAEFGNWIDGVDGVSVDPAKIHCPVLSVRGAQTPDDVQRGLAEAAYFSGRSVVLQGVSHTGLLVGSRYREGLNALLQWLTEAL